MSFLMFMAGFQFVGLTLTLGASDTAPESLSKMLSNSSSPVYPTTQQSLQLVSTFLLAAGFVFSALAGLISFLTIMFCKGMMGEADVMILTGVMKYWWFFECSKAGLFISLFMMIVSINTLCHTALPSELAYVINVCVIIIFLLIMTMYVIMITNAQLYGGARKS